MTNIVEADLRARGYGTADPDRIENIARDMAPQAYAERLARAKNLKTLHGRAIAERIWKRAEAIRKASPDIDPYS